MFWIIPVIYVFIMFCALSNAAAKKNRSGGNEVRKRSQSGLNVSMKTPSMTNRESIHIRQQERLMDALDASHRDKSCTFTYSTQDPSFSFNGRQVVDEFAELRAKNAEHERHLTARVHK